MRVSLPILLAAGIAVSAPVNAETKFGDVVSGIAQSLLAQELDQKAYRKAQSLNTVGAYKEYLQKFPNGVYRANAEQALAKLGASVDPNSAPPVVGNAQSAASIEASIGLSRAQRIQIQKQLTSIGYSTGVADGLWGANTRGSISRWQTANKIQATGYVTVKQINLIAQQAGVTVGTETGGNSTVDDPVEERLLSLTSQERREVQSRLSTLGYRTGTVDGVFGANTRRALASWQQDEGLRVTGYLTADQVRALRIQTGG